MLIHIPIVGWFDCQNTMCESMCGSASTSQAFLSLSYHCHIVGLHTPCFTQYSLIHLMAMTQEPIYWRYLPYVRPIVQAYGMEYPPKTWPYTVQHLHFRILKFPWIN